MEDRSAEVPIPYLLFSHTNTQGSFQSLAWALYQLSHFGEEKAHRSPC